MKLSTIIFAAVMVSGLLISGTGWGSEKELKEKQRYEEPDVIGELTAKIHGTIEKLPPSGLIGTWIVKGKKINVTEETNINEKAGKIGVGVYIEVEGNTKGDAIDAFEIEVEGELVLHGKIEKLPISGLIGTWIVNGKKVNVTADTHIDKEDLPGIKLGVVVDIEGEAKGDVIEAFEVEVPELPVSTRQLNELSRDQKLKK